MASNNQFSKVETVFRSYTLPEKDMTLAGYSALMNHYMLHAPLPYTLAAISQKHKRYQEGRWTVFTIKHKPDESWFGHLKFALKYEGVDLLVLKRVFESIDKAEIEYIVKNEPTGKYSRLIWFYYEWLTNRKLDLPDAGSGNYVDAIDPELQYPGPETLSKRHRVRNNLPGVRGFCPLIRRTEKLEEMRKESLDKKIQDTIGEIHPDLLARAAAFLLLKDSKASYAIEGERPPHNRAERWGNAIGQAGQQTLTMDEILRLQEIVIEDRRFVKMGWRDEEGFVGVHDRTSRIPVPDHISARYKDIPQLMESFTETSERLSDSDYDPVLAAALIAFGFVFIHPLADGNGRIHRYLIHHVLAEMGFSPGGIIFPVSAVILERGDDYRRVLESYSKPRLEFIEWKPTPGGNVQILNETIDLYRFFDATPQAEFLYECVRETVLETLPQEVHYLEQHDKMKTFIEDHFDMPDKDMENLIGFLRQNQGRLSKRARNKEFKKLTNEEVAMLQKEYDEIFQ
jgi:Fic family protein